MYERRGPGPKEPQSHMARQALVILLTVAAFGILVPWYKGFTFLDPRIILAYACLALLFVAPASAEAAGARERESATGVLARMAMVALYGWCVAVLILIAAFVTLNLANRSAGFVAPPYGLCTSTLAFSLAASFTIAFASALLARRFSAAGIKNILRIAFLVVLLALIFSSRFLPESWQIVVAEHTTRRAITRLAWQGAAVFGMVAGGLAIMLLRKSASEARPAKAE